MSAPGVAEHRGGACREICSPFMPRLPRLLFGSIVILPKVDDEWKAIPDTWIVPGCTEMTTEQLRGRAAFMRLPFQVIQ